MGGNVSDERRRHIALKRLRGSYREPFIHAPLLSWVCDRSGAALQDTLRTAPGSPGGIAPGWPGGVPWSPAALTSSAGCSGPFRSGDPSRSRWLGAAASWARDRLGRTAPPPGPIWTEMADAAPQSARLGVPHEPPRWACAAALVQLRHLAPGADLACQNFPCLQSCLKPRSKLKAYRLPSRHPGSTRVKEERTREASQTPHWYWVRRPSWAAGPFVTHRKVACGGSCQARLHRRVRHGPHGCFMVCSVATGPLVVAFGHLWSPLEPPPLYVLTVRAATSWVHPRWAHRPTASRAPNGAGQSLTVSLAAMRPTRGIVSTFLTLGRAARGWPDPHARARAGRRSGRARHASGVARLSVINDFRHLHCAEDTCEILRVSDLRAGPGYGCRPGASPRLSRVRPWICSVTEEPDHAQRSGPRRRHCRSHPWNAQRRSWRADLLHRVTLAGHDSWGDRAGAGAGLSSGSRADRRLVAGSLRMVHIRSVQFGPQNGFSEPALGWLVWGRIQTAPIANDPAEARVKLRYLKRVVHWSMSATCSSPEWS